MMRPLGNQTNSARPFILLNSIPPQLQREPSGRNWKPIKDEIRRLAHGNGLANMPESAFKVEICSRHGGSFALCVFRHENDARIIFRLILGHMFEGLVLQAWLYEPGQNGYILVDGPRDQITGEILQPRSRDSRGSLRPHSNQAESHNHNTVVDRPRRDSIISQDRRSPQPLPAAINSMHNSFNHVGEPAPHMSPYATDMDLHQQRPGHIPPSVGDVSEMPDWSRTLHNTPELSPSSRTSSLTAIPNAYLPIRSSSYDTFQFISDNRYQNKNSSISSTSSPYTPSSSRNQSGSSHMLQHTASDEACKVIIRHVKAGVTHEQLSELLEQKMPLYVQHGRPKQGEDNKWSIRFFNDEDAEKVRQRLNNYNFKGRTLKVHTSNPRAKIHSGGGSTITPGPTIVDGSVTG